MEQNDELGTHIEQLIAAAHDRQDSALADYRAAVDAERAAQRLQDQYQELSRIAQDHHEAKMAEAYTVAGVRR